MPTGIYIHSAEQIRHHKEVMQSHEHREKISKIVKELYKTRPEIKEKISESVKRRYQEDPTYRLRISEGTKRAMKTPEVRNKYLKGFGKAMEKITSPENRKQKSEHFKKNWRNPKCREKMIDALSNRKISDKHRKAMSDLMKKRWENPEFRKKICETMKKTWENKNYQELINKRRHARPNYFEINFNTAFPDLRYVGDYSFFVGRKNPDFIIDGTKKCIDLFGDSFHESSEVETRKKYFVEQGYDLLIIWESEWRHNRNEIIEKTKEFIALDNYAKTDKLQ